MQLDLARPAKDTETKPANHLIKSVRTSGESAIGTASHFRSRFDEQSATRGCSTLCLAAARSRVPSPRGSVRTGKSFEGQFRESQLNPLNFRYWRNRSSPEQRTVTVITVAIPASAVDKVWLGRCGGRARCLVSGSSGGLLPDALIAH